LRLLPARWLHAPPDATPVAEASGIRTRGDSIDTQAIVPSSDRSRRRLAYAAACHAIASVSFAPAIHANFLSALSRDFHLDIAGSSLYLSLNFWGALASIVAAGPLAGRLGSRTVLTAAWILEG
jgi:hypothetical protein